MRTDSWFVTRWNLLGNLLDLGQIAFAPATPEVLRFAEYMAGNYEFFSEVFHGVFATEVRPTAQSGLPSAPNPWGLPLIASVSCPASAVPATSSLPTASMHTWTGVPMSLEQCISPTSSQRDVIQRAGGGGAVCAALP